MAWFQGENVARQVGQPRGLVRRRIVVVDGHNRRGPGVHHQAHENRSEILADLQRLQPNVALPEHLGKFADARQAGRYSAKY